MQMPWQKAAGPPVIYQLNEVFTPGGLPSVTYVGREHLDLERKIARALAKGFAFNVVTGPTKSGKSVLCRKVLGGQKLVLVEGGQVKSEEDFWSHVAYQLNIANEASRTAQSGAQSGLSGEVSLTVPGGGPGAKVGASIVGSGQQSSTVKYENVLMLASLRALKDAGAALLVDDFHYIATDVQRRLIQAQGCRFQWPHGLFACGSPPSLRPDDR